MVIETSSPHRGKTGKIVKICKEKVGVELISEETRIIYYYPKSLRFINRNEDDAAIRAKGLKLNKDLPQYLAGMVRYTLKLFPGISRNDLAAELLIILAREEEPIR